MIKVIDIFSLQETIIGNYFSNNLIYVFFAHNGFVPYFYFKINSIIKKSEEYYVQIFYESRYENFFSRKYIIFLFELIFLPIRLVTMPNVENMLNDTSFQLYRYRM